LQAILCARFIEDLIEKNHRQVILVGDFDADPEATSIRFWAGRQSLQGLSICYRDAWESVHPKEPGHTFTPQNPLVKDQIIKGGQPFRDWPFRRIDYIFVRYGAHGSEALDIQCCDRIFDKPVNGVQTSDH
jgi:endonuclease/exonuclease/phosphatase family metal-dependent hydrolase